MESAREPLRVLFYGHDSYDLGHLRRVLTLARSLVDRDASACVLCVTGSPRPDLFKKPPRCDLVRLPAVTKDARGSYVSRRLPIPIDDLIRIRSDLALGAVRGFRPDLVVVDHAPLGLRGEMRAALDWLRARSPGTRRILGMRDIVDDPLRTRRQFEREGTVRAIREIYDQVLVYGDRHVFDAGKEYGLPPDVTEKIRYVGYVCSRAGNGNPRVGPSRILVCAGGGGDGFPLLRGAVAALADPLRDEEVTAQVVTGPFLSRGKFDRLVDVAEGDERVRVVRAVEEMHRLMPDADLVVSMGGYNSVYEALASRTRLLLWPRRFPRMEQSERARRLEDLGLVGSLADADIQYPGRLANRIRGALAAERPAPLDRGLRFDGADRAAEHILSDLEETRARCASATS